MPSGKTHTKINFFTLPVLLVGLLLWGITNTSFYVLFGLGYVIGTYFITPDMDIKSDSYRKWGIFRFLWYPYMRIMPHRSFLSHTIVLGDIIRVMYLAIIMSPVLYGVNTFIMHGDLLDYLIKKQTVLFSLFVGIVAASTMHIIADVLNTNRKKMFKTKKKKKRRRIA
ncbi:metal-binding protein [Bacillus cereus]|uniref:Peptidase n=1 Tax=Bacillus thuringiensis TaxID=1428 RepID=A0A9X6WHC2_BACTU|nr:MULTISPECIES: metal-binding protein [Bacillus cereus group]PFJ27151.1 peptidase [Bacillus thuringiensis]PGP20989.1 peptidase [Bacillus cereus]